MRTIRILALAAATALVAVPIITYVNCCLIKAWWRKRHGKPLYCDDI